MSPNMTLVGNLDFSLEQPLLLDANSSQHSERKFQHLFSMLSLGCQKERVYSLFFHLIFWVHSVHWFREKHSGSHVHQYWLWVGLVGLGSCAHAFVFYLAMWTTDIVTKCQASKLGKLGKLIALAMQSLSESTSSHKFNVIRRHSMWFCHLCTITEIVEGIQRCLSGCCATTAMRVSRRNSCWLDKRDLILVILALLAVGKRSWRCVAHVARHSQDRPFRTSNGRAASETGKAWQGTSIHCQR